MAARFSLYSGDYENAHRISKKLLSNAGDNPSTPSEMEALSITYWATILEVRSENESNYYNEVSRLERIDCHMQDRGRDYSEVDVLMAWASCKVMLGRKADAINVLNKVRTNCSFLVFLVYYVLNVSRNSSLAIVGDCHASHLCCWTHGKGAAIGCGWRVGPGVGYCPARSGHR